MDCLDANQVQDLMSGVLDSAARAGVIGHLDTCEDCRELLAVTARDVADQPLDQTRPYPEEVARSAREVAGAATKIAAIALDETLAPEAVNLALGLGETVAPSDLAETPRMTRARTAPGTAGRLGHYQLIEKLGAGAMGVVWRADDPKLGRKVALKVLRRHDESLTERLVREARSMAQVNHPNVVTVYEVGDDADGTTFISMELVEGQSLRQWQTAERHKVPAIVAAYVAAGRGLAAAHSAGIIHRDFKPDNVLVGTDGRVRVTDFGLAAAKPTATGVPPQIGDVNLTTSGSVLGTPAYMAPEQFEGGNVDPRTDQFNFCVALYEALYGERPFEGATFPALADNVTEGRVRPAPAGSAVSGALRAIVLRGLAPKPGDRFPTMDHLLAELGRDRARPWRRTQRAAASLAVVLALGLVADCAVRDRIEFQIRQSFELTGSQIDRVVSLLRDNFHTASDIAYRDAALRELAGHHDQADFGLGTVEADTADLEKLHQQLVSAEWVKPRATELAIADYKGRLLYTSAAPDTWGGSLTALPPIRRALDAGKGDSISVLPYRDKTLAATGILGPTQRDGLSVIFERTLALGDKEHEQSEARALYLLLQDGKQVLDEIRLDKKTLLGLVAPDGTSIGDDGIGPLVAAAPADGSIAEVRSAGHTYQVQSRALPDFEGRGSIARVVMARSLEGVLTPFPSARLVFGIAALVALALALGTGIRTRQITSARI